MLGGVGVYVLMLEVVLSSFFPNVMLQLLLPVAVAILSVAGWQIIRTLYRWAPNPTSASTNGN